MYNPLEELELNDNEIEDYMSIFERVLIMLNRINPPSHPDFLQLQQFHAAVETDMIFQAEQTFAEFVQRTWVAKLMTDMEVGHCRN